MKDRPGMGSFVVVKTKTANSQDGLPKSFLNRFGEQVTGILSGLDRVRFRATLRPLFCPNGPEVYLNYCKVLIKNFKGFAQEISDRVKKLAYDTFQQAGRPNLYLPSPQLSKEALVQELMAKEQIKEGPIALLSCVAPCLWFRVRGDHQTKMLRLVMESTCFASSAEKFLRAVAKYGLTFKEKSAQDSKIDPKEYGSRDVGNTGGPRFRAPLSFQQAPKAILAASR